MLLEMKLRITFVAVLLTLSLTSCEKGWFGLFGARDNALTVRTLKTRSDNGVQDKDGTVVYTIGSVFMGGGIADPRQGSAHRSFFFHEKYTKCPDIGKVVPLVSIAGFQNIGVEYTEPGQFVNAIDINGLDESLGYGSQIAIRMNQGKYEGGNELVQDVQIRSYHFSTYNKEEGRKNADADIRIIISMTNGGTITLKFSNDVTPFDGYY